MNTQVLTFSLAVLAAAPAIAETRMDLANEYPAGTIHADIADEFIKELAELTSGDVTVTAHHGGALGYRSADQLDAVGDGAVQMASSYSGAWSGINPIFLASSLPFVAPGLDQTRTLYEQAKPFYEAALEENNQVLLYATPWPPSGIWSKMPLATAEDVANLTIRTSDALGVQTMSNAGAHPIQLSWTDVVPQLSTNGINAVLTSADGGVSAQFWEYLEYYSELNYALPLQVTHMNRDALEALSDEDRAALLEAASAAEAYGWNLITERLSNNYAKLAEEGVEVSSAPSEELAALFAEAGMPVVEEWKANVGEDAVTLLSNYQKALGN